MNKFNKIAGLLTTATGSLLATSATQANEATEEWDVDVAVLVYSEPDRVSALEPAISAKKAYDDESVLNLKLVLDSLTGASHNGATATDSAQTFTRPSGNGSYSAQTNETPLDDTFRDTRVSFSAGYEMPLDRLNRVIFGANVSNEYDFFSMSGSATWLKDINQRNTTLSAGVSVEYDTIKPVGGFADPLSEMLGNDQASNKEDTTDNRVMSELLLGITQVVDRNTLMQFNYGFALSDGYHNDPYKIISVVDDTTGETVAPTTSTLAGRYLYENRPDTRNKQSLYGKVKRFISGDVVDASYRYMWDDWDVVSHTLDFRYRFNLTNNQYIEPHVRYYSQQAAEFYRHSITESEANTQSYGDYLSADYRLGDMIGTTLGLKWGFVTPGGHKSSVRLEYYQQTGDSNPDDAIGIQQSQNLYPDVDAYIFQYNYEF